MAWPYHLLDLTDEQKHERRLLLDQYGVYAQLSAFIPILAYQLYRLAIWVSSERQRSKVNYSAIPSSPTLKRSRASTAGSFARSWRTTIWWLGGEFTQGWPSRGQSIAAGAWTSWLLFLCIHKTGEGTCFIFSIEDPQGYHRIHVRCVEYYILIISLRSQRGLSSYCCFVLFSKLSFTCQPPHKDFPSF
jgi:hypothetical protein